MEPLEIMPQEASRRIAADEGVLIDVREPAEFAIAHIEGSRLIPMQSVPVELQMLERLADKSRLLVLCHHGVRSLHVVAWLRNEGVENCYSVAGGIDRWSCELDPSIPRY